jgi:hypothetical protein
MRHIDDIAPNLRDLLDRHRGAADLWREVVQAAQAAAGDFIAEDEQAMASRSELWVAARNGTGAALLAYSLLEGRWVIYSKAYPHCRACGCRIAPADLDVTPETDDDPRWYGLAVYHGVRCPWILTRAGRRPQPDPAQLAAELEVTLKLLYHRTTASAATTAPSPATCKHRSPTVTGCPKARSTTARPVSTAPTTGSTAAPGRRR